MSLNKQKGNMYPWITHTWNPIRGKCPHDCSYCYMKRIPNVGELRFVEKEMNTNLGKGNKIFMGSSCDMWAEEIPYFWQMKSLKHCIIYPENTYILQTKNPETWRQYDIDFLLVKISKLILGITIETTEDTWHNHISFAPNPNERIKAFKAVLNCKKFISIEPILDFNLEKMVAWMVYLCPDFVSIGADSSHNNLLEPPAWKIKKLKEELEKFTEVKIKDNLKRLLRSE